MAYDSVRYARADNNEYNPHPVTVEFVKLHVSQDYR